MNARITYNFPLFIYYSFQDREVTIASNEVPHFLSNLFTTSHCHSLLYFALLVFTELHVQEDSVPPSSPSNKTQFRYKPSFMCVIVLHRI